MSTYLIEMIVNPNGYEGIFSEEVKSGGWSLKAAAKVAGISGWLSKNEISIGEVLSRVSLSDGKLNADMLCNSIRISQWFGGDWILWGVLVKDRIPAFSLYFCRIPKIHKLCLPRCRLLIRVVLGQRPVVSVIRDIPFVG